MDRLVRSRQIECWPLVELIWWYSYGLKLSARYIHCFRRLRICSFDDCQLLHVLFIAGGIQSRLPLAIISSTCREDGAFECLESLGRKLPMPRYFLFSLAAT
jgi:hypothetical protein